MTNHGTHNLTRVDSPTIVERIAAANHVQPHVSRYAASVELGETVYFWAAA